MSSERSAKYYYKHHKQNFLLLFYEQQKQHFLKNHYNHGKSGKSKSGGGSAVSWIVCSLLLKLIFIKTSMAETLNSAPLQNNSDATTSALESAINATSAKVVSKTSITNTTTVNKRGQHSTITELEREVVERLIKDWAPVVWLAPEEKFLPLGVEEFLAHVHPESKDNSFTPGMGFGENSEKSFLVTNTEIDQLLKNSTSFIYGRNPNISPVPIYAVVTLCHQDQEEEKQSSLEMPSSVELVALNFESLEPTYSPRLQKPMRQHVFLPTVLEMASPTRGPYIPITLGTQNQADNNLRRSSRLYPIFHKTKRSLSNLSNTSPIPRYDFITLESAKGVPVDRFQSSESIKPYSEEDSEKVKVNNFIANLVDNVKFSVSFNENNGVLEKLDEHQMSSSAYSEGTTIPSFHVTYWMFYPYSQGKNMCTLSLGPFGRIPFPAVYGYCLGRKKDIGSHIGDWEHMTLYFSGLTEPEAMYVSAHDAGAYYAYNRLTGSFEFKRQETRKGILQRPNFPKTVTTFNDHPVLFAAKGSHGLWTAPGKHRFVKVARLYDINGFGTPWNTWKYVQITYENLKSYGRAFVPSWLSFKGKWGNPKSKCHPLRRIGLNFCEFTDGPTGIPLKEPHFECGTTSKR